MTGRWREAVPELAIAAALVLATAVAGYLMAGWMGLAVVAITAAAIALVVVRGLLPLRLPDSVKRAARKRTPRPVTGYSHRKFVVDSATGNRGFYDTELRPVLEHLLAARLAERHGVNLYQDPAAARRLFCRRRRDAALWPWIDPAATQSVRKGTCKNISRPTLARLVDRLEKL